MTGERRCQGKALSINKIQELLPIGDERQRRRLFITLDRSRRSCTDSSASLTSWSASLPLGLAFALARRINVRSQTMRSADGSHGVEVVSGGVVIDPRGA